MRRIITALAVGGVLAAAVFGAAASLGGLFNTQLSADDATVVSCEGATPDGVFVDYGLGVSPGGVTRVTSVLLSGLADGCLGQNATVYLEDGIGSTVNGTAPVIDPTPGPASPNDNLATVVLGGTLPASAVTGIHVTVRF